MSPHSSPDQDREDVLSSEFASAAFIENEVKLDAPNKKYLDRVWDYIQKDRIHYHTSNSDHTIEDRPDNIDWDLIDGDNPDPYGGATKYRYRYYFDTRLLSLFNASAEIRLQKGTGEYKQVIKIGNGATKDQPMMGRAEHPAIVRKFKPSFTAIRKKEEGRSKTIKFLNDVIKKQGPLKPLVAILSQRRKTEYHPEGNRDVTIEFAVDIGKANNVAGFQWNIRQIELEIKENKSGRLDSEILQEELERLTEKFPELLINTESKPSPGFRDLAARKISKRAFASINKHEYGFMEKRPELKAA